MARRRFVGSYLPASRPRLSEGCRRRSTQCIARPRRYTGAVFMIGKAPPWIGRRELTSYQSGWISTNRDKLAALWLVEAVECPISRSMVYRPFTGPNVSNGRRERRRYEAHTQSRPWVGRRSLPRDIDRRSRPDSKYECRFPLLNGSPA
jgi:hypothetical protein